MSRSKAVIAISIILSIAVGFFAGIEYKTYQLRKVMSEISEVFSNDTNNKSSESEKTEKKTIVIEKKIGDEISLATLKIKVNNIEEKNILSESSQPAVAKEGAKFIVIDAEITNITNGPFDYDSNGVVIIDNKDRKFEDYGDVFFAVDNYLEQRALQPSIAEKGKLVYEIADDAEHYSLSVKKAGTSEEYRISLK
ncbi:MAG: hypothetical protein A2Z52_00545 [Candidatus Moranbacteria bacterium RBG_19FT_COMBO_42_6]|nr:MAG: hypothetical protein A2Z52_00545 [Candidatus Moranbacteria bacterium RBG_19FT_COMBO_42_6]